VVWHPTSLRCAGCVPVNVRRAPPQCPCSVVKGSLQPVGQLQGNQRSKLVNNWFSLAAQARPNRAEAACCARQRCVPAATPAAHRDARQQAAGQPTKPASGGGTMPSGGRPPCCATHVPGGVVGAAALGQQHQCLQQPAILSDVQMLHRMLVLRGGPSSRRGRGGGRRWRAAASRRPAAERPGEAMPPPPVPSVARQSLKGHAHHFCTPGIVCFVVRARHGPPDLIWQGIPCSLIPLKACSRSADAFTSSHGDAGASHGQTGSGSR
jgi:hypothetical protein